MGKRRDSNPHPCRSGFSRELLPVLVGAMAVATATSRLRHAAPLRQDQAPNQELAAEAAPTGFRESATCPGTRSSQSHQREIRLCPQFLPARARSTGIAPESVKSRHILEVSRQNQFGEIAPDTFSSNGWRVVLSPHLLPVTAGLAAHPRFQEHAVPVECQVRPLPVGESAYVAAKRIFQPHATQ